MLFLCLLCFLCSFPFFRGFSIASGVGPRNCNKIVDGRPHCKSSLLDENQSRPSVACCWNSCEQPTPDTIRSGCASSTTGSSRPIERCRILESVVLTFGTWRIFPHRGQFHIQRE